jgi:molecular chaperone GrpE (heat shock protein)
MADSEDIVERLREAARFEDEYPCTADLHVEAADEIERLRAELAAAHQRITELKADNEKWRQRVIKWVNAAHANEEWDE